MGFDANRTPISDSHASPASSFETDGAPLFRVVRLADLRLSPRASRFRRSWDEAIEAINSEPPDLVVAVGLTLDGADCQDDLVYAAGQLRRLRCPVLRLPGLRDIGSPEAGGSCRVDTFSIRRDRYLRHIGADWWMRDICGWRLIGLNTLLFGSDLDAELDQLGWLEAAILDAPRVRPVVICARHPLCEESPMRGGLAQHCWRTELGAHAARLLQSAGTHLLPAVDRVEGSPAWLEYHFDASTITCRRQGRPGPVRHESFNEA